ncbi:ATP-binding protein [Halovivax limisalsi]|uniref:ATP-binding protein n=1 Tax=Halovivax limisalsi TaxID=1453760 RepID=UPI001FFD9B3A|nr:tetratricopeptide repeat protein [Halovivax limisalsi]
MASFDVADLVVLALDPSGRVDGAASASAADLAETIAFGESLADRVQLLSVLSTLAEDGLLAASVESDPDRPGERTRYALTDVGRERAAALRESLRDERVTIVDGDAERACPLLDVPEVADRSVAAALVERSPSGELVLESPTSDVVDRADEVGRLRELVESTPDAGARSIVLAGDRGVGKTTVVEAVLDRVREDRVATYVGRASPGGDVPFGPVRDAFAAGTGPADDPFDVEAGLETPDETTYRARRASIFAGVADALVDRAAAGPVAFVVEDLQWADSATIDLLAYLTAELEEAPVALLCTHARDGVAEPDPLAAACSTGAEPTVVELAPFDRATTARLIEAELGSRGLPEEFTDAVYAETGGNPLFVVETVTGALETGALDPRVDRYPADAAALSVPDVVEETSRSRFERLEPETLSVVAAGAVLDEPFSMAELVAHTALDPATVRERADLLVDAAVWREVPGGYRFRSESLRRGARSAIDADRRRDLHREVAIRLADEADPNHASIADHFERAGEPGAALVHYRLAGADAEAVYAHDVAVAHYERALSLAREQERDSAVLELLESLGDCHYTRGAYDEADRHFRYVRSATDEPDRVRRSYVYQARVHHERNEYERAKALARRGLEVGGDEVTEEVCWLYDALGSAAMKRGEYETAIECFETQREYAASIGFDRSVGRAFQSLGSTLRRQGSTEAAIERGERAVDVLERAGADRELATCLNDLALSYRRAGRAGAFRETIERAHELAERTGNVRARILATHNLADAVKRDGDRERARSLYDEAGELADRAGDDDTAAVALWNRSLLDVATGDVPAGIDGFERALERIDESEDRQKRAQCHAHLGRTYAVCERFEAARRHVATAQRIAADDELDRLAALAAANAGSVARASGDLDRAIAHGERARSIVADLDDARTTSHVLDQLARSRLATGEATAALKLARRAEAAVPDEDAPAAVRVGITIGGALRAAGEYDAARDRLEAVREDAVERSVASAIRVRRELARLARDTGAADRAREHYASAIDRAESAGATRYVTDLTDERASLEHRHESA